MAGRRVVRPMPITGKIWTPEELADRWATNTDNVDRMCRQGRIAGAFKVGRQWRLSEEALVAYERGGAFGSVAFTGSVAS